MDHVTVRKNISGPYCWAFLFRDGRPGNRIRALSGSFKGSSTIIRSGRVSLIECCLKLTSAKRLLAFAALLLACFLSTTALSHTPPTTESVANEGLLRVKTVPVAG